jgi:hypothetical protein
LNSKVIELMNCIKWKGGRLEEKLKTHAHMKGQLTIFQVYVYVFLMTCWLSSVRNLKLFPRGRENMLICLLLLIDKRSN